MRLSRRSVVLGSVLAIGGASRSIAQPAAQPVIEPISTVVDSSFSHRMVEGESFRYSFSQQQLQDIANNSTASVIVHHGAVQPTEGYFIGHRHVEGLPLYVSKNTGINRIKLENFKDLINGDMENWQVLGGNPVPVAVAVRHDGVFGQAIEHLLLKTGVKLPPKRVNVASYQDLANFGAVNSGSLLLGLRGASSRSGDLIELSVDGKKVSEHAAGYPIVNEITVLFRKEDPQAVDLGLAFADSLKAQSVADSNETRTAPMIADLQKALMAKKDAMRR
jgi:hypothetical protein